VLEEPVKQIGLETLVMVFGLEAEAIEHPRPAQ
jgi:hypothetical protein